MVAMTKQGKLLASLEPAQLLERLIHDYTDLTFVPGKAFCWSPRGRKIIYKTDVEAPTAMYSLLHEVGHAILNHRRYKLDFELMEYEVAAWEQAKQIAPNYGIDIDEGHIQDCLDSYRDWLYRRSICPSCTTKTLQHDDASVYNCFNCHATWSVAPSRFCRPYRQTKSQVVTSQTFAAYL
jgi:ribosomal protein L37AE/L43A